MKKQKKIEQVYLDSCLFCMVELGWIQNTYSDSSLDIFQ